MSTQKSEMSESFPLWVNENVFQAPLLLALHFSFFKKKKTLEITMDRTDGGV